jgi:2-hydroxymuconate-semialdehyde hydrolase
MLRNVMRTHESSESVPSLYDDARFAVLGSGPDRVRVCFFESALPSQATPGGDQPPRRVLLIHGNPSQIDHWAQTVPAISRHAAVLAYDQPGLGRSDDFDDGRHSLERSVDLALALLDHVGWSGPVDLMGQSHGGFVSLALAARAPERVRSVLLLGTGGTPAHLAYRLLALPGVDRLLPSLAARLFRAPELGRLAEIIVRRSAKDSFSPDPVPASIVVEEIALLSERPSVLRTLARLAQDGPCEKIVAYAREVKAPVLFIHGGEDDLVPISYARRLFEIMQRSSRDVRFLELRGGHMIHFTQPRVINPLLDAWLATPR